MIFLSLTNDRSNFCNSWQIFLGYPISLLVSNDCLKAISLVRVISVTISNIHAGHNLQGQHTGQKIVIPALRQTGSAINMKIIIPLHFILLKIDSKRCCDTTMPESIHAKDESKLQFSVCFHLWCELTTTINVTERQVSCNSCLVFVTVYGFIDLLFVLMEWIVKQTKK